MQWHEDYGWIISAAAFGLLGYFIGRGKIRVRKKKSEPPLMEDVRVLYTRAWNNYRVAKAIVLQDMETIDFVEEERTVRLKRCQHDRQSYARTAIDSVGTIAECALQYHKDSVRNGRLFLDERDKEKLENGGGSLKERTMRALALFAKYEGVDYKPDFERDEWEKFTDAIKCRNRLTHANRSRDLEVLQEELVSAKQAFDYVLGEMNKTILEMAIYKKENS